MKFGVLMNAFRERNRIKSAIEQFDKTPIEKIVVTCSHKSWFGNMLIDDTPEIARSCGAYVIEKTWEHEHEQKNEGMEALKDMDWVIISAPDMYMTRESINNLIDFIENVDHGDKRAYGCGMKTYWKNLSTIVKPDWGFNTVVIRKDLRFEYSARLKDSSINDVIPGVMVHHLSWVKTNDEMFVKINSYTHAPEIIKGWFENVWLKWNKNMTDFHLTTPTDYKYVVHYQLPYQLEKLLNKEWLKEVYLCQ